MKVIGNPNGEYRGKRGGDVFSRNKSGAIARSYVVPTNRNSSAQRSARTRLAAASQGFRTLTAQQVASWAEFAKSGYNPSRRMNVGQMSGANAYTALAVSAQNGSSIGQEASFEQDAAPVDAAASFTDFGTIATAPLEGLSAELQTDNPVVSWIPKLDSVTLSANFKPTISVGIMKNGGGTAAIAGFQSADDTYVGSMFTMSSPNAAQGRVFKRNDIQTLAIVKGVEGLTADVDGGTIDIVPDTDPDYGSWVSLPPAGSYVNVGMWLIAPDGRKLLVGYKEVQYTGS